MKIHWIKYGQQAQCLYMFFPLCDSLQNHPENKMLNEITKYFVILFTKLDTVKLDWDSLVNNGAHAFYACKLVLKHWNFQDITKIEKEFSHTAYSATYEFAKKLYIFKKVLHKIKYSQLSGSFHRLSKSK